MDPTENPDGGRAQFAGTPFGNDDEDTSHVQPLPDPPARGGLPGEQEDPRLC